MQKKKQKKAQATEAPQQAANPAETPQDGQTTETCPIEVEVGRLREALALLKPVVPKKPTIPVLSHVLLKDSKAHATDLEVGVAVDLPGVQGSCLLPYAEVVELLKHTPGAQNLTIQREGKGVRLSWEEGKATFEAPRPEDYPPFPQMEPVAEGAVEGDTLVSALLSVVDYCATEETRPILTGVAVNFGETMELAAGEGFRMAYQTLPSSFPHSGQVVIPARAMRILGHLWEKAPPAPELEAVKSLAGLATAKRRLWLALSKDKLQSRFGSVCLVTQLIQGSPPNFRQLIPEDAPLKVKVMAADLERAVRQVERVAHSGSGIVRLVWSEDTLRVSAKAEEKGETEAAVPVMTEGGPGRVAVNYGYLLDYLKGKQGMVTIGVRGPQDPILFRYRSSPLVLIMPMLVQW